MKDATGGYRDHFMDVEKLIARIHEVPLAHRATFKIEPGAGVERRIVVTVPKTNVTYEATGKSVPDAIAKIRAQLLEPIVLRVRSDLSTLTLVGEELSIADGDAPPKPEWEGSDTKPCRVRRKDDVVDTTGTEIVEAPQLPPPSIRPRD